MLLEIYDKNTYNRVDVIRSFTFVQYTDYFNDVGTFSVKVPTNEPSLPYLLKQGNYILFEKLGDKFIMGVIKYFHCENVTTPIVEIKGYMLSHLLTYRCFLTTYQLKDKVFEIQRDFVQKFFIGVDDFRRQMDIMMIGSNYDHNTEVINYCQTGSDCAEGIREMNEPYHYGFALVPAIAKYNEQTDQTQNIMNIVFEQYVPTDRSIGNADGNDPVVFDTELSNIENLMYEVDGTKAKTVAIVAGEDKGADRKLTEVGDVEAFGVDRNELYVDARDLQKQESGEIEYSISEMTGDGTIQTVWNSASVESLQNVHISQFTVNGNISVSNQTEQSANFKFYIIPYLGGVSYPEVVLVNETVEVGKFVNFNYDVVCNASDNNLSYYDSYAIFCVTSSGVTYKGSGKMFVDSIPAQNNATTDEEYIEMLSERGREKLKENSVAYGFEATAFTDTNTSFQYGRDYKNGDYVSIINRELGMVVKVQIVGVTKSLTETGEILDLIFGNQIL